ncbi:MAG: hypothetical protein MG2_0703 [uncultured Candidatus Poseidoniales archaeon]|nr:MAG: hypothetical protein MG2_0703 [uncultured Candidatus Poseidoniales archaeon]
MKQCNGPVPVLEGNEFFSMSFMVSVLGSPIGGATLRERRSLTKHNRRFPSE